ncbi:MAG: amidohydrolase [Chloroflexi bacterium]|nr:amidohydrolase [Chloroflexota bacterium]
MIIDTHVHIVSGDRQRYPHHATKILPAGVSKTWASDEPVDAERLFRTLDRAGVDKAVIVQPMSAYQYDNSYAADSGAKYSARCATVGIIDVLLPDAVEKLTYWVRDRGMNGLRLFTTRVDSTYRLDDPATDPVWRQSQALKIPVTVHMQLRELPLLKRMVERFPGVTVAVDHLAATEYREKLTTKVLGDLLALAPFPNVQVKYSTLTLYALKGGEPSKDFFSRIVERFGARRLMWGSNYPATYDRPYAEMVAMAKESVSFLPKADQNAILGENAARLYPRLA